MSVKEKILKIMALCLEINPPEINEIGQKKTAVFFRWSPHCNVLSFAIHSGGWVSMTDPDIQYDLYLKTKNRKSINKELNKIIKKLEAILEGEQNAEIKPC